ncbi:MAG: hypothetical protein ABFS46_19965 [Myxococcota bacterium]
MGRLLRDLDRSGQSVAAFSRDRGIPANRLYWARRRARQAEAEAADFEEVTVIEDTAEAGSPIELRLPHGITALLSADFDEVALHRLLALVAGC